MLGPQTHRRLWHDFGHSPGSAALSSGLGSGVSRWGWITAWCCVFLGYQALRVLSGSVRIAGSTLRASKLKQYCCCARVIRANSAMLLANRTHYATKASIVKKQCEAFPIRAGHQDSDAQAWWLRDTALKVFRAFPHRIPTCA